MTLSSIDLKVIKRLEKECDYEVSKDLIKEVVTYLKKQGNYKSIKTIIGRVNETFYNVSFFDNTSHMYRALEFESLYKARQDKRVKEVIDCFNGEIAIIITD